MGTAGHIDHGKTSLIYSLTQVECDTHSYEKEHGITVDLGFTHFKLPNGDLVGVVDVPGHHKFIPTMLKGAFGIDFVLFLIAADSGVQKQSKEHLQIFHSLGLKQGIIVITKIDLVDQDVLDLAILEAKELVKGTFLEHAPLAFCSNSTGEGVEDLKISIEQLTKKIVKPKSSSFFRMIIDRNLTIKGVGSILGGVITQGILDDRTTAYIQPGFSNPLKIRSIQSYGHKVNKAIAGDRVAINIPHLDRKKVGMGAQIVSKKIKATKWVDATFTLFGESPSLGIWTRGYFYSGTWELPVKIHLLDCNHLLPSDHALVQISFDEPINIMRLDRFIIRDAAKATTLGGGVIFNPYPVFHRRRPKRLLDQLRLLQKGDWLELVKAQLNSHRPSLFFNDFMELYLLEEKDISKEDLARLSSGIKIWQSEKGAFFALKKVAKTLLSELPKSFKNFHLKFPFKKGATLRDVSNLIKSYPNICDDFLLVLLEELVQKEKLHYKDGTWALAEFKPFHIAGRDLLVSSIYNYVQECDLKTPLLSEMRALPEVRELKEVELQAILAYMQEQGFLISIQNNWIDASLVERVRLQLLNSYEMLSKGFTVAEFRDLIKANRKLALLLLSRFDREGICWRSGDLRFITELGRNKLV